MSVGTTKLLARQELEAIVIKQADELKAYRNKQVKLEMDVKKANSTILEIREEINHFADKINLLAIPRH